MTLRARIEPLLRSRFLRFGIVGAGGFVVDTGVLSLLHYGLKLDPYTARLISILCAMTFTWWGNRQLTFAAHAVRGVGAAAAEWLKFVAANAVGAVMNYGVYTLLVRVAPWPTSNPIVATGVGVLAGLLFNFTLSKRFVFRAD
ncbi:MAG: GtrA family protein [Proteobacteria bacterium]|nr:GtrA family protein [Pseudomonadota bacterium]